MPLSENGKIMLGWLGVWVSGGFTFYFLQKQVEAGRKERIKERRLKRRERERKKRELEAMETPGQQQLTENI